jgi:trans-aconitate methyltransferase
MRDLMIREDDPALAAWQREKTVRWFLDSVRGAIPFAREQFAVALQIVANGRQPVHRFLDLGAGDGVLSAVLLARYPAADPVLLDFSPPMLVAAKERLAFLASQLAFVQADLATPVWREAVGAYAPFDAIVSSFAIHHLGRVRKPRDVLRFAVWQRTN